MSSTLGCSATTSSADFARSTTSAVSGTSLRTSSGGGLSTSGSLGGGGTSDSATPLPPCRYEALVGALCLTARRERARRDAVMAAGRELGVELAALDPLDDGLARDTDALGHLGRRVPALAQLEENRFASVQQL